MTRTHFIARARSLAAAALLLAAPVVSAQNTLVFTGDDGDYISQGQTWSYTDGVTATANSENSMVSVSVWTDTWWNLELEAPAGQQLVPGTYEGATRYPFNDAHEPGLTLSGDGRGCNTSTGRFVVHEAEYGPFGYVINFRASFEQHCEGMEPAAWGEVVIANPPPPEALSMTVQFDSSFPVSRKTGRVTVGGTITCSASTTATLNGTMTQRVNRFSLAQGGFYANAQCGPTPTRFTATLVPDGATPFGSGQAQFDATVGAYDPNYGGNVTENISTVVSLKGGK